MGVPVLQKTTVDLSRSDSAKENSVHQPLWGGSARRNSETPGRRENVHSLLESVQERLESQVAEAQHGQGHQAQTSDLARRLHEEHAEASQGRVAALSRVRRLEAVQERLESRVAEW